MDTFNVVIIGAGPAGCQCARSLAKLGYNILLVEQHQNFEQNNFSSAATPLETLEKFSLPGEIVGSFWRKIVIETTNVSQSWESEQNLGAVLDFAKLRKFLAEEVQTHGGKVWLGCRYIKHQEEDGKICVVLKKSDGQLITVTTEVLVDATGFARAVIYKRKKDKPKFLKATGIEYLIEVKSQLYENYQDSLIFFLGHKWMPMGYAWIFPMEKNFLKIGVAIINGEHKIIEKINPLQDYLKLIINDYLKQEKYKLIDIHGSIVEYSRGLNDIYSRNNIIAIGDAVSTINMLGGEGIRHGMSGANIASKYIKAYLEGSISSFSEYEREMQSLMARKWNLSEKICSKVYLEYSDSQIDKGVSYLKNLNYQDMMDILFSYKFAKASQGLANSWLNKIRRLLQTFASILLNRAYT